MDLLLLASAITTGLAVVVSVLRYEVQQRRTHVYTVTEFDKTFGGVK